MKLVKIFLLMVILGSQGVRAQAPDFVSSQVGATHYVHNRIVLNAPFIAEGGNDASIGIKFALPDHSAKQVRELWVFDEVGNEQLARFTFAEKTKSDGIWLRVRMPHGRKIYAVARLNDNSAVTGKARIYLASGCVLH